MRLTVLSTPPQDAEQNPKPLTVTPAAALEPGFEPAPVTEPSEAAPAYWLCARAPGAATQAVRVWGLWMDGGIVFSTDTESVAAGDAGTFHATLVQADGDGVSLVDGIARRVEDAGTLSRFAAQCAAKYGFEPDPDDPDTPIYALAPT
jgi:hypothetical protein